MKGTLTEFGTDVGSAPASGSEFTFLKDSIIPLVSNQLRAKFGQRNVVILFAQSTND